MKKIWFAMLPVGSLLAIGWGATAQSGAGKAGSLDGHWDLTLTEDKEYPSWLDIEGQHVRLVGRVASVKDANDVKLEGSELSFTSKEDLHDKQVDVKWQMHLKNGHLFGSQTWSGGMVAKLMGSRAPELDRAMPKSWGQPKPIFNGKDLTGWQASSPDKNKWKVEDGALVNTAAGANLQTTNKYKDFKLHIEFNCPQDGNSGVYLRGRYETQVEYEPVGANDPKHGIGSIYGFIAPAMKLPPMPGQWESYDITLVGRTVTVVRDGKTTIDAQKIPGITGGALDSHEGEPGRFYIQGDHTGGMKYRNITVAIPSA